MIEARKAVGGVVYAKLEESDNSNQASLVVGSIFVVPSEPIWIAAPTERNTTAGLRVVVAQKVGDKYVPMALYRGQLSRKDRRTGEWSYDGDFADAVNAGHVAFNAMAAGKAIKVTDTKVVGNYAYTDNGEPILDADGNRTFVDANAYDWEVADVDEGVDLNEIKELCEKFVKTNYGL